MANPAPSGLLAFGMTTALLGLHHTGTFPLDSTMLGMGVFYGGLGQIVVGFVEWKRQHLFGAAAFTSFGLFWLSLIAMTILPGNRFGEFHQDTAMTAYLVLWGLFTAVLFLGALKLNRSLQFVLGSLILFYLLLAAGTATGSRLITAISGWAGVFCAFAAIYTGLAQILNEIFGRAVAPLGEHDRTMDQTIQKHPS
ncbi:acetate uptake transporter [Trichloromonas sp.]|uniref:acetate uptake transporter n=1 Tax=Trichloromonas sp. TaxID=3069249 RepID=UPI003D81813D